jgi:hypothetical protein
MKKAACLGSAMLAAWAGAALGQSYTHSDTSKVGYVQVGGSTSGVNGWRKPGDGEFPGCTTGKNYLWLDGDTNLVTEATRRSMLATLLTAKVLDKTVTAFYVVDAVGYCRVRYLAIN